MLAGVVLFDQAVLMERPRLPLAGAFVARVVADDARVISQSLGILSDHVVGADVSIFAHPGYAGISGKNALTVAR